MQLDLSGAKSFEWKRKCNTRLWMSEINQSARFDCANSRESEISASLSRQIHKKVTNLTCALILLVVTL